MEIKEVRKKNLLLLIAQHGGIQAEFARAVDVSPGYLNQILNNWQERGMGTALARRIEKRMGKPKGWMDSPHSEEWREKQAMSGSNLPMDRYAPTRMLRLAAEIDTLSETSIDAVVTLVESLKKIEGQRAGPPPLPPGLNIRK